MTTLQTKTFDTLVSDQAAAVQGGATRYLADFTVGSILRAAVESFSSVVLWLQGLILHLLTTTRASTSKGSDLDTWMADYGVTRLEADYASGQVTFSRFTATLRTVVPVGSTVQTADGTQTFTVVIDTTNVDYSTVDNGYVIAAGISSVNAPVTSNNAGSAANVVAGGISALSQSISGVDTVTNALAFINGADAETDQALLTRFIAFIASLARATKAAVGYAATSLATNLSYTLVENLTYGGASQPGYFYVVIDDGTGYPPSSTLAAVAAAIDAIRPVTSTFGVFPPTVLSATVTMTITTASGYTHSVLTAAVQAAVTNYINGLAMGASLPYSRLAQIAYDASPGITNVSGVLLNSGTADLAATAQQVIVTSSVIVS